LLGAAAAGLAGHMAAEYGVDGVEEAGLAGPHGPEEQDPGLGQVQLLQGLVALQVLLQLGEQLKHLYRGSYSNTPCTPSTGRATETYIKG
jgi:hypothetical protein